MEVLNIMRLSSRFILDNLFLLAAAFLVVASMTWPQSFRRVEVQLLIVLDSVFDSYVRFRAGCGMGGVPGVPGMHRLRPRRPCPPSVSCGWFVLVMRVLAGR
jgi:hypothetical protein